MGIQKSRDAEGLVSREDLGQETEFGGQKDHLQGLRQRVLHADQIQKVLLLLSLWKSRLSQRIIRAGA
jgi:hypothetical protein